jgi:hypothetical protein
VGRESNGAICMLLVWRCARSGIAGGPCGGALLIPSVRAAGWRRNIQAAAPSPIPNSRSLWITRSSPRPPMSPQRGRFKILLAHILPARRRLALRGTHPATLPVTVIDAPPEPSPHHSNHCLPLESSPPHSMPGVALSTWQRWLPRLGWFRRVAFQTPCQTRASVPFVCACLCSAVLGCARRLHLWMVVAGWWWLLAGGGCWLVVKQSISPSLRSEFVICVIERSWGHGEEKGGDAHGK